MEEHQISYSNGEKVAKPSPLTAVSILGMGNSLADYVMDAYNNPAFRGKGTEVWAVNSAGHIFQCDKVFNMHDFEKMEMEAKHLNNLKAYERTNIPIITVRALDKYATTLEFPLAQVVKTFNDCYFRNTISYMIAFAILCEVKQINFFGCDFNYVKKEGQTEKEVIKQNVEASRQNVEYWMGMAKARGIALGIAPSSTLLDMSQRDTGEKSFYGYSKRPQLKHTGNKIEIAGFNEEFEEMG